MSLSKTLKKPMLYLHRMEFELRKIEKGTSIIFCPVTLLLANQNIFINCVLEFFMWKKVVLHIQLLIAEYLMSTGYSLGKHFIQIFFKFKDNPPELKENLTKMSSNSNLGLIFFCRAKVASQVQQKIFFCLCYFYENVGNKN